MKTIKYLYYMLLSDRQLVKKMNWYVKELCIEDNKERKFKLISELNLVCRVTLSKYEFDDDAYIIARNIYDRNIELYLECLGVN